jgi:15-cis-phytoene synthase
MSSAVQPMSAPWSPTDSQLAVAYSVCRNIARTSARNFYYAFLVLPKPKRQALCAVYAFMRRCDDIADDPGLPLGERQHKLNEWLDALHRAQSGQPTDDPVLLGVTDAQRRHGIPAGLLDDLAGGTALDVQADPEAAAGPGQTSPGLSVQYRTFDDLRVYCYRVASVVGLACIRIFGYRDPAAEPLAEECGLAFQLTNIIRDVKEDAQMGRVYLPAADLAKFNVSPFALASASDPTPFIPLLTLQADRARVCYGAGDELMAYIDEDSQPALWVLVTIYRRLLEKIVARNFDVFRGRVSLTTREKLSVLLRGFLKRLA